MAYLFNGYRKILVLLLASAVIACSGQLAWAQLLQRIDPGVAVEDRIELKGSAAIIDSYNSWVTFYAPDIENNAAVVTVNSPYSRTVRLSDKASIKGDVYVGPGANPKRSIRLSHRSTITGQTKTLYEDIPLPSISEPNMPPFNEPIEGDMVMRKGQQWILDVDMHLRRLTITNKSVLTIEGNVLLFVEGDFVLGADAQLQITRGSTLDLFVSGDCKISGQVNSLRTHPRALHIYMLGRNEVFQTTDGAAVFAVLQNPDGAVHFDIDTQFYGRIKARSLKSAGPIHIDLDSEFPPLQFVRQKPRTRTTRW